MSWRDVCLHALGRILRTALRHGLRGSKSGICSGMASLVWLFVAAVVQAIADIYGVGMHTRC